MRLYHHSVSVATLGVTLHLFTAGSGRGGGLGGANGVLSQERGR